jgi:hypothetical protein
MMPYFWSREEAKKETIVQRLALESEPTSKGPHGYN